MKHPLQLLLVGGLLASATPANACVDYWTPPPLWMDVHTDSAYTECLITVHGMELFGGSAGAFCTCGLSTLTNLFNSIQRVAFVEAETYTLTSGFGEWQANTSSSNAWDGAMPGTWAGFIAEVIGAGLPPGTPVDLVIRATLGPGFDANSLQSAVQGMNMGTDEWSFAGDSIAFSHNSVGNLGLVSQIVYHLEPASFFNVVDGALVGMSETSTALFSLYPVPADDRLNIILADAAITPVAARIHSASGAWVRSVDAGDLRNGTIDLADLEPGVYIIELTVNGQHNRQRFIRQ